MMHHSTAHCVPSLLEGFRYRCRNLCTFAVMHEIFFAFSAFTMCWSSNDIEECLKMYIGISYWRTNWKSCAYGIKWECSIKAFFSSQTILRLFFSQPNAVEALKTSPRAGFCLPVTRRPTSTTCTVSGTSRRHLEAPSGLYLLFHYLPIHHLSSHLVFCVGCLHLRLIVTYMHIFFDIEFKLFSEIVNI